MKTNTKRFAKASTKRPAKAKTAKQKAIAPMVMYRNYYSGWPGYMLHVSKEVAARCSSTLHTTSARPTLVIDLGKESVEAARDKANNQPYQHRTIGEANAFRQGVDAALAAIGIVATEGDK